MDPKSNAARQIIILGTGGSSIDILDTINEINAAAQDPAFAVVGFLDDDRSKWGDRIFGVPVLGPLESAGEYPQACFINGISAPSRFWRKEEIIAKTSLPPERFATIIHPSATVSNMAEVGPGTAILQNVTVASAAKIGRHVIVLPNSVVSHDVLVGDYTCIAGGVCISGGVTIGKSCYLGTNSALKENVRIGDLCLVGMGAVVLDDVSDNSVVVGNPARFLRHTVEG